MGTWFAYNLDRFDIVTTINLERCYKQRYDSIEYAVFNICN